MIKYYTSTNETLAEMGSRIKHLRLESGITQAELSKKSGVSVRTIINIESGKDVSFSNFIAVLRSLNALEELDMVLSTFSQNTNISKKTGNERQRVKKQKTNANDNLWKWGDDK